MSGKEGVPRSEKYRMNGNSGLKEVTEAEKSANESSLRLVGKQESEIGAD